MFNQLFQKKGIILVDFKIEFGRLSSNKQKIVLADEISPDSVDFGISSLKQNLIKMSSEKVLEI